MDPSPATKKAIAVWGLARGSWPGAPSPPETFLEEHARFAVVPASRVSAPGVRLYGVKLTEIAALQDIGRPEAPSLSAAVSILRRVRGTSLAMEAVEALLHAPGPVPELLRIEAAYLCVRARLLDTARDVLLGAPEPAAAEAPPLALLDSRERRRPIVDPRRVPTSFDRLTREVRFLDKTRDHFTAKLPYAAPTDPAPAIDTAGPAIAEAALARLALLGLPDGPSADEARSLLRATRGTGAGVRALHHALAARANGHLPEPVRVFCAELLAEMGERERALAVLADAPPTPPPALPPPGIDVDTPLADRDAGPRAAAAEQVLGEDLARLGVRERHARFTAVARAAALTVEAFLAQGGQSKRDDLLGAARALEDAGELGRAAEIYALAGAPAEAARLGLAPSPAPSPLLAKLGDLDRRGLRLLALTGARRWLDKHSDPEVAAFARSLSARLLRGPTADLLLDDRPTRVVFGEEITLGRSNATLVVPSPLLSRPHLRVARNEGAPFVEDLRSHNGTWLAGARLAAPIPIGEGVDLSLGREISCALRADQGGVALTIAGERTLLPLGPLPLPGLRLIAEKREGERVVSLEIESGARAALNGAPMGSRVELSMGDAVQMYAPRPGRLRVVG